MRRRGCLGNSGGYQTRSLSLARYRYLTPYYADAKGPGEISYHRRTPAEYDREPQYAIDAGIDYFAYCRYGEEPHAELDKIRASFRDALAHGANDPLKPAVNQCETNTASPTTKEGK